MKSDGDSIEMKKKESKALRVAVILGGKISSEQLEEIEKQRKPRIDVIELEKGIPADLFDYSVLNELPDIRFPLNILYSLSNKTGDKSSSLIYTLYDQLVDYDVVFATGEDVGLPFASMLRINGKKKPYIIMRLEQIQYGRTRLRKLIYEKLATHGLKRVDRIICRTTAYLDFMMNNFHLDEEQLVVFPETTDTLFFNPSHTRDPLLQKIIPNSQYIFSAGLEMRDYETLIRAVANLEIQVVIAAGSPWSKFDFSTNDSLPANIHVERYSLEEMRELYRHSSLVVVPVKPTIRACGMNVVLEASAMKKPIIASKTAGMVDFITDGETGCLVEPNDSDALRANIIELLNSENQANLLGCNANEKVLKGYDLDQYTQFISAEIDQLTFT